MANQCDVDDDAHFVDVDGFSCQRWAILSCTVQAGFESADIEAVQESCPYSCGRCAQAEFASTAGPSVRLTNAALGLVNLVVAAVLILISTIAGRSVLLNSVLRPCFRKLNSVAVLLRKRSVVRCSPQSSRNSHDLGFLNFVRLSKYMFRLRLARLLAVISLYMGMQHWLNRATYTPCVYDASSVALALREICHLGTYVSFLFVLLPSRMLGSRGLTFAISTSSLFQMAQLSVVDVWWLFEDQRVFTRTIYRILILVCLNREVGICLALLQVMVLCASYFARLGYDPIRYYEDQDSICFMAVPDSTDYSLMSSTFSPQSRQLSFTSYLLREVFTGLLVCVTLLTLDWILDLVSRALAHLSQMQTQKNAFSSILGVICDCLVHLNADLRITEPAPRLAAMLIRSGGQQPTQLVGQDLRSLLASSDDVARLTSTLCSPDAVESRTSSLMHLCMKDSLGAKVTLEVHWTRYLDMNGDPCFILGLTEDNERLSGPLQDMPSFPVSEPTPGSGTERCDEPNSHDSNWENRSSSSASVELEGSEGPTFTFNLSGEIFDSHNLPSTLQKLFRRNDDLTAFMSWCSDTFDKVDKQDVPSPFVGVFRPCTLKVLRNKPSRSARNAKRHYYVKACIEVSFDQKQGFRTYGNLVECDARLVALQSAHGSGTSPRFGTSSSAGRQELGTPTNPQGAATPTELGHSPDRNILEL
eukprot:TRINITY_DN61474_c0_g1_i1.p1 TRINITY_DN61474_c0_g1~~TRINITY_DN61474_c0_g1_i1.p1  ORF type:complete len:754 (-),score=92.87 TRINITY_DN61474_c0_g1_i1:27-2129(-)